MKLTGRDGVLRIYESSINIHGAAPLDNLTIQVKKYDGVSTWVDITTDVEADDAAAATAFLTDDNDEVYIGSSAKFAMIKYLKGNGSNYAAVSGALIADYYNGSSWVTLGAVDGTASGGNCFAQDGYISFKIPKDWVLRGNVNLSTTKYYIRLKTTTAPTTDPDADVLAPVDGQHLVLPFSKMDFSGPLGRPLNEEILVLNRETMDSLAHYIKGSDDLLFEPMPVGFSCMIDSTYALRILKALECDNPGADQWTSTGTSTKGDTKNDGTNSNPAFADSTKKTVNIQILWKLGTSGEVPFGMAYYEAYFPKDECIVGEGPDEVPLTCKGGCFGVIERMYEFGNRY